MTRNNIVYFDRSESLSAIDNDISRETALLNDISRQSALISALREMNGSTGIPMVDGNPNRAHEAYRSYAALANGPAYGVLLPGDMMPAYVIPPYVNAGGPYSYEQPVEREGSSLEFHGSHPPFMVSSMTGGRYPHMPPPSYMSRPHYSPYAFGPMLPPRGLGPILPNSFMPPSALGPTPFGPMFYPPSTTARSRMHPPHFHPPAPEPRRRRTEPRPETTTTTETKEPIKRSLSDSKSTDTITKIEDEDGQCCICLEEPSALELASINGCAHNFCFTCIEKWSDRENTCPLCKTRFTKIDRVNKPPPYKKRKRGEQRTKLTKKVRNRDQRADVSMGTIRMPNPDPERRHPGFLLFGNLPGSLLSIHNALGINPSAATSNALNHLAQQHPSIPFNFGDQDDFYWRI